MPIVDQQDLVKKMTEGLINNNGTQQTSAPEEKPVTKVSPSGRQLPVMPEGNEEDIVDKIGNSLEGGYAGTQKRVEASLRPTSKMTLDSIPFTQKQNNLVSQVSEKINQPPVEQEDGSKKNRRFRSYSDVLNPEEETPEQKKKREKRERMGKIFAAVGDGVSALSNLWFATKGAPSSYNPDNSILKRTQAREDYLRKENFANDMSLLNSKIRLKELSERLKRQEAQDKYNQDRLNFYNKQEERRQKELDYKQFKAETDADYKNGSLEVRRELAQIQRDLADGRITLMQAQARYNDAKTRLENAKAGGTTTTYDYTTDAMGNKVKTGQKVTYGNGGGNKNSSNTPPSRSNSNSNSNTPPSRRK